MVAERRSQQGGGAELSSVAAEAKKEAEQAGVPGKGGLDRLRRESGASGVPLAG